jgi:hypothetical protein
MFGRSSRGAASRELRQRLQRQIGQGVPVTNVLCAIPARSIVARFGLELPLRSVSARPSSPGSSEAVLLAAAEQRLARLPLETIPTPSPLPEAREVPMALRATRPTFATIDDRMVATGYLVSLETNRYSVWPGLAHRATGRRGQ